MTDYKMVFAGAYGTGRRWSTGAHFSSGTDLVTALSDWATQVNSFWTNGSHGVQTLYATSTILDTVSVLQLGPTMHIVQELPNTVSLPGTDSSQEGANQLAILASLRNPFAGARNRGRMYLPSPAEDTVNEGVLGTTEGTRVSTAIIALFSGMRTAGYTPFVFNREAHPLDPIAFTKKTLTSEKIDRVLLTQDRRIEGELALYV